MCKKVYKTDFLYSTPTFFSGVGTVFNIFGNYYKFNYTDEPDKKAIESDWKIVGQDIKKVISETDHSLSKLELCEQ